ncbi:MAG: 50S ribosomal protein L6 [Firmicutes bacterium]|nr:50S ribosomal protein L6 [Bacillota bacterium]
MSRIGRKPIEVPNGVEIKVEENNRVTVKGPKGTLSRDLHPDMQIVLNDGVLEVHRPTDGKEHRSLHGLTRTLLANMVEGVTKGFEKKLEAVSVGWRASVQGNKLVLNVGYSHPVEIEAPEGIEFKAETVAHPPYGMVPLITVSGIDKEKVGQTAATIRSIRKPEPYLGKGIQYQGEKIRRKAGKTAR